MLREFFYGWLILLYGAFITEHEKSGLAMNIIYLRTGENINVKKNFYSFTLNLDWLIFIIWRMACSLLNTKSGLVMNIIKF